MMAIAVVLIALLVQFVTANGALSSPDNYVVDLGYQLNQGHTVVVSFVHFEPHTIKPHACFRHISAQFHEYS